MPRYYHPSPRGTTEDSRRIDLSWLRAHNYLTGFCGGNLSWSRDGESTGNINVQIDINAEYPSIRFTYRSHEYAEDVWKDIDYSFPMTSIPCRYGGRKWFFICGLYKSGNYCGRKARILYGVGKYFGCRHCANLSYQSCNENKRSKYAFLRIVDSEDKADKLYSELKRKFYKGKPTRKYRKYLKMTRYSNFDIFAAEKSLHTALET
jgi:hypothetical protein